MKRSEKNSRRKPEGHPRDLPPDGLRGLLRKIPQVEKVLREAPVATLVDSHSRTEVVRAIRDHLAGLRQEIILAARPGGGNRSPTASRGALAERIRPESIAAGVRSRLDERARSAYGRAVNATGIILHTGLGRAVYSSEARAAIAETIAGYSVVEIDLATGERNRREVHLARLLQELTGAESATVVNNNAGATLIILAALARGKEVVLSRGQMVEIGGAFRIPEILEESGARLVGVGTTNRTYIEDYRRAIGPGTGMLLQVHTSNYEITGFARHTPLEELVALGREHRLPVVSDLGSGCLVDLSRWGFPGEPLVGDSVRAGADLVCFSGDKLLGGPQAGLIVGRREAVDRVRAHPLFRTLRVDKVTLAGLEATLRLLRDPRRALEAIPTLRMIAAPEEEVKARAARFLRALRAARLPIKAEALRTTAQTGSGSLPARDLPSWSAALEVPGRSADALDTALRANDPPILARILKGRVVVDFRTLLAGEEKLVLAALARIAGTGP
jgi:L-seryl-tRNA(Ser) seleniumtransferase